MKLYRLDPVAGADEWLSPYDKAFGFIVAARDIPEARDLASKQHGDEGPAVWRDPHKTSCEELEPGEISRVIMRDFNAG